MKSRPPGSLTGGPAKEAPVTTERELAELPKDEALRLLGSVPFGRVVFTARALPAVRPVNHLVDGNRIIIRTSPGAAGRALEYGCGRWDLRTAHRRRDRRDPARCGGRRRRGPRDARGPVAGEHVPAVLHRERAERGAGGPADLPPARRSACGP